jgi:alpha/beta superfamily hydrolase
MPIARIVSRHVDRAMYDAINASVDIEHRHPLGLIMHGAAEFDGTMHVAQVWESAEYARRYDEEILRPALRAVGAPLDADVILLELHQLVTP